MTATAAAMTNSCALMPLAPEGVGEAGVEVAIVGEIARTRSFGPYPFSMRIWNAGPKASCQAELFAANCSTYGAVSANEHLVTLLLQARLLSEPSALGWMLRCKL